MLSIIIPALNEEDYLPLLLAEIKRQDFDDYEIIVADADSEDDTLRVAKAFGCKTTQGGLPAKGRNEGAKIALGDLLLFIDADAVFLPENFLKNLVEKFQRRNLDIASFQIYPKGNIIDRIFYAFYNLWAWLSQRFLAHATNVILVKKEIHELVGGFDETIKFAEDHEYVRRIKKQAQFGFINLKPVLVSARRFEKDGRIVTYLRYGLAAIWMFFLGPIKSNIFNYKFGYSLKSKADLLYNISDMYKLPKYKLPKIKFPSISLPKLKSGRMKLLESAKTKDFKTNTAWFLVIVIVVSSFFGFLAGAISGSYFYLEIKEFFSGINIEIQAPKTNEEESPLFTFQEQAVVNVVNKVSPSVVSIVITKDLPVYEKYYVSPFDEFFFDPFFDFKVPQYRQKGTEKKEIGGGTGFIVSEDGMILTNKHVVLDDEADYTVILSDGRQLQADILAKDPLQDLAILKISQIKTITDNGEVSFELFPKVELGDSDQIQIGQTAIAIGYVLGRYQNAVSVGVISGLGRTISASGGDFYEILEDVIQTDTAINKGNSGGPLLNTRGQVIGINTAIDLEGQSIGFAIPVNKVKKDIEQVKTIGRIVYPFLGVRYVIINKDIQRENDLEVDYGAWVAKGSQGEAAVFPGSAADNIGIKENDIVLEFNGEKINVENTLANIIIKYNPDDEVILKILSNGQEKEISVVLGERSE
ncbi:MAG: trypsin-like peptidase domain-containing protein [Patescibacteria group bacterium]|nr:trypsin-like peptidase domain-containing protein [Patescibacteria group bacterium]